MSWQPLFDQLSAIGQGRWVSSLANNCDKWLVGHGDYSRWRNALDNLPPIKETRRDFSRDAVTIEGQCEDSSTLRTALLGLAPWRKGPFQIADVFIDSEWHSYLKWNRVLPHLSSLKDRRVLDVGCGNGYYAWRMLDQDPALIIGIEPSVLFNLQFQALNKYLQCESVHMLPLGVQDLPEDLNCFHTVFSMGVLYHRRSPIDHLYQLRDFLVGGGELCLETLVVDGKEGEVLLPEDRYARMRNVWFIPSVPELLKWLRRCGFIKIRVVDENQTGVDEQRSTEWMQFESLVQSLDPENHQNTVEGLPAPRRAVVLANKP